ncbi:hypothetical protein WA026_004842 [Henosepilachna vigintioctopunctata]|uniref:Uncharacterized protein n=1 Tax=Henosepilachna vigintioctopunctata TaxID=420089 RepID=A0AAW1UN32_9CUCU
MVRWLEPQKETEPTDRLMMGSVKVPIAQGEITDDPLAAIEGAPQNKHQIYSVTRSVMLPRISITKSSSDGVPQFSFSGGGLRKTIDMKKNSRKAEYTNIYHNASIFFKTISRTEVVSFPNSLGESIDMKKNSRKAEYTNIYYTSCVLFKTIFRTKVVCFPNSLKETIDMKKNSRKAGYTNIYYTASILFKIISHTKVVCFPNSLRETIDMKKNSREAEYTRVILRVYSSRPYPELTSVNPLFKENMMYADISKKIRKSSYINRQTRQNSIQSGEKSGSSGYSSSRVSSNVESLYNHGKEKSSDAVVIVEQNPSFVKSIRICRRNGMRNSVPSSGSGSSSGTLNAIPEGKIDLTRTKAAWNEDEERRLENYDSIVDDALLLYTSLSYVPEIEKNYLSVQISVTELLVDILKNINSALDGHSNDTPEDVLQRVTNKINLGLQVLKNSTEEDMKKLCVNLRNCKKVNSVLRAFSNSNSSSGSGEWSSNKPRSSSSDTEDFYQSHFSTPSSSAFSDSVKDHSDSPVTYDRAENCKNSNEVAQGVLSTKTSLLRAVNDDKPSTWEQYYGVKAEPTVIVPHVVPKPTDVPIFVSIIF